MKAECSWGNGPDVLVVLEGKPVMLYHKPHNLDEATYGYISEGSACLTAEEAEKLAQELLIAAKQAKNLNRELISHLEREQNG